MKAALIATGNEIVSGQTVNTNASLLANLLSQEGVEVVYHLAVLDRVEDLEEALRFVRAKGVTDVFTIGGLGPTRDDLTRRIIADYFGQNFIFKDELWGKLEKFLTDRKVPVREEHKWQCYFPEGSNILRNDKGTAHGFKTNGENFSVWCLPGPPEELKSVYTNGIKPWLDENVHAQVELLTWQCIGVPESDLAHKVEKALEGCSYELGYRASSPFVEVKLWVPAGDSLKGKWVLKVEKAVENYLYSRGEEDYLKAFVDMALERGELVIQDQFSRGDLFQSLLKSFKGKIPKGLSYCLGETLDMKTANMKILKSEDKIKFEFKTLTETFSKEFALDHHRYSLSKWYSQGVVAKAIKAQYEWLKDQA